MHVLVDLYLRLILCLLHVHCLLHRVVLAHSHRVGGNSNSVVVQPSALVLRHDLRISVFSPIGTPHVLDDPVLLTLRVLLPSDNLHDVLSVEFEGILSSVVETLLVSQEVSEDHHLGHSGTVLDYFTLNAQLILGDAVVNDLVECIVLSALVHLQVVVSALSSLGLILIASLRNESLPLSPVECSVDIATSAAIAGLVTVNEFLS